MIKLASFWNLVRNENMKIYYRVRTWIMLGILAAISALFPVLFYLTSGSNPPGMWDSVNLTSQFTFFLSTIFVVVIASDSVAGEFSWGTIKLLLIRPWSRSQILLSKYLSVFLFGLFSTLILVLSSYVASGILFGFTLTGESMMGIEMDAMSYVLLYVLCEFIELVIIVSIAFMLSAVFRSNGLAIGVPLFILFTSGLFRALFNPERYEWARYVLFTHLDLNPQMIAAADSTLGFSLMILGAYYAIFMATTWIVFIKRDVAA